MTMTLDTDSTDRPAVPPIGLSDLRLASCGLLMGAADTVPGVSGGTVALILGIYHRLVTAISRFDRQLIRLVRDRQWRAAAEHVDLRFVIGLGTGVASGIAGLSFLMNYLLEHQAQHTAGVFFGLILGSGLIVARSIPKWTPSQIAMLGIGTGVAYFVVGIDALQNPPDSLWYLFLTGMIGICAMILPGISGAFILLILGKYHDVLGLLRSVLKGDWAISNLLGVAVFCLGCLTGLLGFSRLLRWLLAKYESVTLATLCGLMLGSLRKIWPFKVDLSPEEPRLKLKRFANVLPETVDGSTAITIGLAMAALAAVLTLEAQSRKNRSVEVSPAAE